MERHDWEYSRLMKVGVSDDEFLSALTKHINGLAQKVQKNEPIIRCVAISKAGHQCLSLGKERDNGLWLCNFHKNRKVPGVVSLREDKLAKQIISNLGYLYETPNQHDL
jgi:hypothetical protein